MGQKRKCAPSCAMGERWQFWCCRTYFFLCQRGDCVHMKRFGKPLPLKCISWLLRVPRVYNSIESPVSVISMPTGRAHLNINNWRRSRSIWLWRNAPRPCCHTTCISRASEAARRERERKREIIAVPLTAHSWEMRRRLERSRLSLTH